MVLLLLLTILGTVAQEQWGAFRVMPLIALWIMQLVDLFTLAGDVRTYNQRLISF